MRKTLCTLALVGAALGSFSARAASQAKATSPLESMKTLVGTWEGTNQEHEAITNTIRVVSNGTAIEETFQSGSDDQMVTLCSRDGDRLAMVHLCSLGNQPRMETPAGASNANAFDFSFTGATNLATPADPHMQHMLLQIVDRDHFTERWTLAAHGTQQTDLFHFTRKKS